MERYDVKRSILAMYVKNEAESLWAFESEKLNAKRERLWKAAHLKLKEALLRSLVGARDAQLPLSGLVICPKAEKYAVKMKTVSFKASEGWFARFKDRHGLVFRKVPSMAMLSMTGKTSSFASTSLHISQTTPLTQTRQHCLAKPYQTKP